MTKPGLKHFFEEQVRFRLSDGTLLDDSVFIGETELLPVESLQEDPDAYDAEFNFWLDEWLPEQEERRGEILGLAANEKRYADLFDAVRRGQVVPFVGSGMSVPSGLPTWSDLLRKIREHTKADIDALENLLCASMFEEAADLLAERTNRNLLDERIEHNLRVDDPTCIGGAVRLLPAMFSNLVITTNLDNVLETVYRSSETPFGHVLAGTELSRYRDLKDAQEHFLLKLHGDCRRADNRVLLTAEYETAYAQGSAIRDELELLYRSYDLLFLGCSLGSDRTLGLIKRIVQTGLKMPKHYAFVAYPEDDEDRLDREQFLTAHNIYPIWYRGSHNDSILALLSGLVLWEGDAAA